MPVGRHPSGRGGVERFHTGVDQEMHEFDQVVLGDQDVGHGQSGIDPAESPGGGPDQDDRRGTTVSEARIIPVPYSPVISSTPRTPMAGCAKNVPVSDVEMADWPAPCHRVGWR